MEPPICWHRGGNGSGRGEWGIAVEIRVAVLSGRGFRIAGELLDITPVLLCGATGAGPAEGLVGAVFLSSAAGVCDLIGGGEVFEEIGNELCADAFLDESLDFEGAHEVVFVDLNGVADPDGAGCFGVLTGDHDLVEAAGFCGLGAGLIDAHGPEPYIDANGVGHGVNVAGAVCSR